MKILVTGANGLLGSEITKLDSGLIALSREELDVTDALALEKAIQTHQPKIILHLAAATNPPEHEANPEPGLRVNIIGTANMALACLKAGIRLVYVSSDYLYTGQGPHKEDEAVAPTGNFYLSKLAGECAARLCPNSLVLRLSFGPAPYPWEKVYNGQYCSKLYVDEMAPVVLLAAKSSATGIMNLGGPRVTLEAYAKRTVPDIATMPRPSHIPADVSLDISKMKKELKISDENSLLKH